MRKLEVFITGAKTLPYKTTLWLNRRGLTFLLKSINWGFFLGGGGQSSIDGMGTQALQNYGNWL